MKKPDPTPLPLTSLSFQILLALADEPRHGYGIIKEVFQRTGGEMELETGTLYTALRRLRDDGFLAVVPPEKRPKTEDARRKTYRLTPLGKKVLEAESVRLAALVRVAIQKKVIPSSAF